MGLFSFTQEIAMDLGHSQYHHYHEWQDRGGRAFGCSLGPSYGQDDRRGRNGKDDA